MKEESKIYTQDDYFNDEFLKKEPKQHVELINDNIEEFDKLIELFKQETLEEVAERLYPIILEDDEWDKNKQYRDEWIEGVKWQQERSYRELELFINELKDKINSFEYSVNQQSYISEYMTEWFEQSKKK